MTAVDVTTAARALADGATLDALAEQARDAHAEVEQHGRATVAAAIRAGEALIAAKAKVKHGEWLPWLAENFPATSQTAQNYMRVANAKHVLHLAEARTLNEALALVAGPPRGPREPEPDEDDGPLPGQTAIPTADAPHDDWRPPTPADTPSEPWPDPAIIERGLGTFVEVGQALREIRDKRQYRDAGFERFEDYLRERWSLGLSHGKRMIDAALAADAVAPIGAIPNESVARELAPVAREDPERARAVWSAAVERHGPTPTAKQVAEIRDSTTDDDERSGGVGAAGHRRRPLHSGSPLNSSSPLHPGSPLNWSAPLNFPTEGVHCSSATPALQFTPPLHSSSADPCTGVQPNRHRTVN